MKNGIFRYTQYGTPETRRERGRSASDKMNILTAMKNIKQSVRLKLTPLLLPTNGATKLSIDPLSLPAPVLLSAAVEAAGGAESN